MQYENIIVETRAKVGLICLNRPKALNALNDQLMDELGHALLSFDQDELIGCIVITGSEKAFAAGADISAMANYSYMDVYKGQYITRNWETIRQVRKPVIAAVAGYALGGGCELAMACHMRVASDNARFGQPEVNLGLLPGYGGTQRLPQLVGKAKAIELLLTADQVKADEALRLGLVNHVVPLAELLPFCRQLLGKILGKAPLAVGLVLECVNAHYAKDTNGYAAEVKAFGRAFESDDFKEGTTAFVEKRPAVFQGK